MWGRGGGFIQGGCLFNFMAKGVDAYSEKDIY